MAFRQQEKEGLGEEKRFLKTAVHGRMLHDAHFYTATLHPSCYFLGGAFVQGEFDERMTFTEGGDRSG